MQRRRSTGWQRKSRITLSIRPIYSYCYIPRQSWLQRSGIREGMSPRRINRDMPHPMQADGGSAIWLGAVLRGSDEPLRIGKKVAAVTSLYPPGNNCGLETDEKGILRAGLQSGPVLPRASSADSIRHQAVRILQHVARQTGAILQQF